MILHIPHSSTLLPSHYSEQTPLTDAELLEELYVMTDWHTDQLFDAPSAHRICFPWSRLLVDVERFADDADEPMAEKGMGRFYTRTHDGRLLRPEPTPVERTRLVSLYNDHHNELTYAVDEELERLGEALIVDAHSFPDQPLPCNLDQTRPRPDICIGMDSFHSPEGLVEGLCALFFERGYRVEINRPFSGCMVPKRYYRKNPKVRSVMIEVNRRLYLHNDIGFRRVQSDLRDILATLDPEVPDPLPEILPEPTPNPVPEYRVEWSDDMVKRSLATAYQTGKLVLPTSRIQELEICSLAFESAGGIQLPDCGHVILHLKEKKT
ncbi:N-formylglutamate amidohydrolase [Kiritimatiellota bacterium B12222]|nr:N-formylglutamate amidohydrolase [Kiritimatiellota bacterium B12222]